MQPLLSVIIPCRNEEKFISKCLDFVVASDYPKSKLEVLVVDGMSKDKTREIITRYSKKYFFIKLLDNPKKYTPSALNIGIKSARGKIIIRMDAHATYAKDYISKSLKYLKEYKADNVGGVIKTIPRGNNLFSSAITLVLAHPFGAGDAYYITGSKKPRWTDTVFGGCYRKEIFKKIGLYNENLIRSQDIEFNLRLRRAGGKILLAPDIVSYYYPRTNLWEFSVHNFINGFWSIYPFKFTKKLLRLRHYIPLVFVSGLIGTGILGIFSLIFFRLFLFIISLYLIVNIYFSLKIAYNKKDLRYLFLLPIVFGSRHIGYGLGSVWALINLLLPTKK